MIFEDFAHLSMTFTKHDSIMLMNLSTFSDKAPLNGKSRGPVYISEYSEFHWMFIISPLLGVSFPRAYSCLPSVLVVFFFCCHAVIFYCSSQEM